jgi:hypothetical protein
MSINNRDSRAETSDSAAVPISETVAGKEVEMVIMVSSRQVISGYGLCNKWTKINNLRNIRNNSTLEAKIHVRY